MSGSPQSFVAGQGGLIEDMSSKEAAGRYNSAAAFVEAGGQEVFEDSCSICLDTFTFEEPCTKTVCNHDYHLQCILEWAQRSTECPMCWQSLSLKDSESQELLAACTQEQAFAQASPSIFLRSSLEEFEFHHRYSVSYPEEADLERRIMHHLAAAAAGTRGRHLPGDLQDGPSQGSPSSPLHSSSVPLTSLFARRFSGPPAGAVGTGTLVVGGDNTGFPPTYAIRQNSGQSALSTALNNPENLPSGSIASSQIPPQNHGAQSSPQTIVRSATRAVVGGSGSSTPPQGGSLSAPSSGRLAERTLSGEGGSGHQTPPRSSSRNRSGNASSCEGSPKRSGDSGGGSESLGDALKTRWAAASSRYRESLSKGTRTFRERFRLQGGAVADLSAKAREVGAGMVRAFERISDPGASTSDRPARELEDGSSPPRAGAAYSSSPSHSRELSEGQTGSSDQHPSGSAESAQSGATEAALLQDVRGPEADREGVQAGSVKFASESRVERASSLEPLKAATDATADTESHQAAPLAA